MRHDRPGTVAALGAVLGAAVVALVVLLLAGVSGASPSGGTLLSFGYNYFGQLGSATNDKSSMANPTPTAVALPGEVTQAAAGSDFSLAVTSTGQLYGFGDNQYGQLGNATNNVGNTPNPVPTLVALPGEGGTVTQVAAGYDHTLAVTSSGQLYAFGDNYHGQLGNATNEGASVPNPTPTLVTLPGGSGTVTQVAAGDDFSLVVTSTGELFAFGDNEYGQLGFGANNGTNSPNPSPTEVQLPGGSGTVTAVAAGDDFSLVATSAGDLYSFGNNYYGQLGTTTNNGVNTANPSLEAVTLPGQVGSVTQLAAGSGFGLAVTSSGQLYAFGANYSGQLGIATNDGMTGVANPTPTLVALPGESGTVTAAAAGQDFSLVVTSSGQLYAFGDGGEGQLGSATVTGPDNATPKLVSLPSGIAAASLVAAGVGQSLVIGSGGSGSGGSGGSGSSRTVTLTIDTIGSGTGSVYGSLGCAKPSSATPSCSESFPSGTVITLDDSTTGSTAFVGWESIPAVTSCFGRGICTFTLTADTTVTGVFETPQLLTTTVEGDGQGFVESADYSALLHRGLRCQKGLTQISHSCTISYSYGTEETLTALPAGGSKFVGWSGPCAGTSTCTVLMDRAQDVTASFFNDVGIHVNAIEVTQGIQTTELPTRTSSQDTAVSYVGVPVNSLGGAVTKVKFAADHATVVRVYVNTALPLDGEPVPVMRLYAFRNGQMLAPGPITADRIPSATGFPVGPLGQVTAAQRYGQNGVYTFTLPWGWAEGTVNFLADTNLDPTEFFDNCDDTDCQDRGLDLDLIHFNPVTVARIAPIAITVSAPASHIRGVSRPIGPLGWNSINPQPDPVWQTVQQVVPFPIEVPPYVEVVDGTQAVESCDGVKSTATPFAAQVYSARNAALRALVTQWADSTAPTPPGGSEFQNSNPAIYPFGLLQPLAQAQSTCTPPAGPPALGYSGGQTNTGGGPGAPVLYGSSQPISISTDNRPITGIAHEFHHGIGLPHAGEVCGSGTVGTAQTVTGSTTAGSSVLTLAAAASGLAVGQPVTGPGWPAPASTTTTPAVAPTVVITAINGSQLTMDAAATSTTTNAAYTFATTINTPPQSGSNWPPTLPGTNGVPPGYGVLDGVLDGVGLVGLDNEANSPYVFRGAAVNGTQIFDLMSYCTNGNELLGWISVRNWNYDVGFHAPGPTVARDSAAALHGRMTRRSATSSTAAQPQFTTSPPASAGATRTLAVTSYYDINSGTTLVTDVAPDAGPPTPTHPNATYTLTARDASGQVVASAGAIALPIHVDPGGGNAAQSLIQIQGKVPATGVREIDILQDGRPIEEDHAAPDAPTVTLLSPAKGTVIGGPRGAVIRWRAQERGGDALDVTVDYSADGGRSYRPIYTGPNHGSVLLPSYLLSASRNARVRLYVSDGFNEAIITSSRFIARGAPPMVHITEPHDGAKNLSRGRRQPRRRGLRRRGCDAGRPRARLALRPPDTRSRNADHNDGADRRASPRDADGARPVRPHDERIGVAHDPELAAGADRPEIPGPDLANGTVVDAPCRHARSRYADDRSHTRRCQSASDADSPADQSRSPDA